MSVRTARKSIRTRGNGHVLDLTREVAEAVRGSGIREGIATVFVTGSTAGITTLEFEPGTTRLEVELEQPGQVDIEEHESDTLIARVLVK